jgi:hypothetical protein
MPSVVLDDAASTTLSAAGAGTVRIGPNRPATRWRVTNLAVLTSTAVNVPQALVYRGSASPVNLIAGTSTGSQDSTDLDVLLFTGQVLTVVWSGGDVGATATASVYGQLLTGGY